MKAKRFAFVKQYQDFGEARWSKVFFFDEFTIQQFSQRKQTVCKLVGIGFNYCYKQAMVKHHHSVMIWKAMSSNGTAGLFTTWNDNEQCQVLQNVGGQAQNSHGYS